MASTNGERGDLTASVPGQMGAIGDGAPPSALTAGQREWLVIEDSMRRSPFATDDMQKVMGYIPRDVAENELGIKIQIQPDGRCTWFTREQGDAMRAHPEWRNAEPPSSSSASCRAIRDASVTRPEPGTAAPQSGEETAASLFRVVLTYRGGAAQIIDAREHIQIAYRLPCPSGMRGDLRKASWRDHGQGRWQRQQTAATIASAREILARYYGAPE